MWIQPIINIFDNTASAKKKKKKTQVTSLGLTKFLAFNIGMYTVTGNGVSEC